MMMALAVAVIIGQGAVAWLLLRLVKTFGIYTQTLVEIHRTNLMIMERNEAMVTDLDRIKDDKEAA